ncbi:MAG: glycosyl transferase family 4 family protein [Asticcacaulis sp.]
MVEIWLLSPSCLLVAFFVAAGLAMALTPLIIKGGPIDMPRARGSHPNPTPTSGGLSVMAAIGLTLTGLLLLVRPFPVSDPLHSGLYLLAFASLMGLSGAVDDVMDLPARARLLFQAVVCICFACLFPVTNLTFGDGLTLELPTIAGVAGTTAWLILGINAINFMDGSNGLAIGTQIIALLAFAFLIVFLGPTSASGMMLGGVLLILVAAAGGFFGLLPFNLPLGRVFQGDAGSLFGGALITGTTVILKNHEIGSVWLGGFLLAPLLVDVVLTLILRLRQGKDLFTPHKDHLYQQWLMKMDPSHLRLSLIVWILCGFSSLVGVSARLIDHHNGSDIRFALLVCVITLYSLGWLLVRRHLSRLPDR